MSSSVAAASHSLNHSLPQTSKKSTAFKSFTVEDILRKDPVNIVKGQQQYDYPKQDNDGGGGNSSSSSIGTAIPRSSPALAPHEPSNKRLQDEREEGNDDDEEKDEDEEEKEEGKRRIEATNQTFFHPPNAAASIASVHHHHPIPQPVTHRYVISHHQSPGASPSRSSSSSSASSSVSETSLAGNLLNIRNSRSCSYYPNHHHQRLSHEHHDHHSAPSLLHHAPHPPHPLLLQPPQDQGIRALQQFYHQHPSNSHYFTNRQPVISGVSYGNLHGHRSAGTCAFPSHAESSPSFPRHLDLNLHSSSSLASSDHESLHELNIISNSGRSASPDFGNSQQQQSHQQVHPIFAVSPSSGITYSWISPPKSLPRKRTVFSRTQRTSLESKFQSQKYISKSERIRFARELGLKDSQVKVWFINRRTKWRNDREKKMMSSNKSKAGSVSSCSTTSSTISKDNE